VVGVNNTQGVSQVWRFFTIIHEIKDTYQTKSGWSQYSRGQLSVVIFNIIHEIKDT